MPFPQTSRLTNAVRRRDSTFSISCGIHLLESSIATSLQHKGFRLDTDAEIVILLDLPLGFALQKLRAKVLGADCVVVTWSVCPEYWEDILDYHPKAVLPGHRMENDMSYVLHSILENGVCERNAKEHSQLTHLERRILRLIVGGNSNNDIAQLCGIQEQTVKNTATTIYQKLGLRNRTEAVLYYWNVQL